jgi:predicted dehydrogenase
VISVGVIGCNYGRTVLAPAFRHDPRCDVVALAGTDAARTARLARAANIGRAFSDWQALVEDPAVLVVAIAVPPSLQPPIAQRALELGKPVFLEKPLAADLPGAQMILDSAVKNGQPTIVDFNFPELPSWQRTKTILDDGAIGRLHNVVATWNFENEATRLRLESWKTHGNGGGLLGNFVSHCFYNLEWLCGPISGLCARIFALPDRKADGSIALALAFASGAGGSLQLSCASFLGSGHRIELYGEKGTLVLSNPTADYFRGFELKVAAQGEDALKTVSIEDDMDEDPCSDSRTAPVRRLVRRFIDACEKGGSSSPGVAEGYRVQCLIDAARRAHATGRWIEVASPRSSHTLSAR